MLQAVAHEVKNLLAELALRVQSHDPHAAALAHNAANKLAQALLLTNIEQIAPQIDAASPVELLNDLAAEYGPLFPHKTLVIEADRAPVLWYYDTHLMRLALSNVVHNALRHCTKQVTLRSEERDGRLHFEVQDDGEGFSERLLDMPPTRRIESHSPLGTGLGLAITHRIVQAHTLKTRELQHGSVQLRNCSGAAVTISIP